MDTRARLERIWNTIREIPPGRVASYGQVAEIAGIPRGARLTAYALRKAPKGHKLPWYRVVTASGRIAFPRDSQGYVEQRDRLMMEGVAVVRGKVDMRAYRWQPDLDELLWKPTSAWDE